MPEPYVVRDISLAASGMRKIDWVRPHMPVLEKVAAEIADSAVLSGLRLTLCLHLEAKTARLALALQEAGALVSICGSNPLSTQDDVAAALAESGVHVYAWHGATDQEYSRFLELALGIEPQIVVDDGADLVSLLHERRRDLMDGLIGASEETTTGLHRIRALHAQGLLSFPVMAVNDARCKYLFDNRYGTGQSVWDSIMRNTNLVVAGKKVVVVGYGWCGKGVAARARGLGARVIVTEVDPVVAIEALMDGFEVMPLVDAAPGADVVITVTGSVKAVGQQHLQVLKSGAFLANAGHFNVEIDVDSLDKLSTSVDRVRENIERYQLGDGRHLYLMGEGRLVNLAAGDGHPTEIMDLSFALQALAAEYLAVHGADLEPGVHLLGRHLDDRVARLYLESVGIGIDAWDDEQQRYATSWK